MDLGLWIELFRDWLLWFDLIDKYMDVGLLNKKTFFPFLISEIVCTFPERLTHEWLLKKPILSKFKFWILQIY